MDALRLKAEIIGEMRTLSIDLKVTTQILEERKWDKDSDTLLLNTVKALRLATEEINETFKTIEECSRL